jgi:hypothetical protein
MTAKPRDANDLLREQGEDALRRQFDKAKRTRPDDQTKARSNGPTIITAPELVMHQFGPVKFVIDGYLPEGLALLVGKPKVGKSWLALDWAIAVATGGAALGVFDVDQGDALYLALEDNQRRLKDRLLQALQGRSQPDRLHIATEWPRLNAGGAEAINDWCARMERPRLVVIDVFGKVRPARSGRENLYDSDYDALSPLKKIADTRQLALLTLHHLSKRTESDDPFDAVSGTNAMTGAPDTVLILKRSPQGVTLYGRGRDLQEIESAVKFDPATGLWSLLGEAAEVHRSAARTKVLTALQEAVAPIGPAEIAAMTGMQAGSVRRIVGKMVAKGEIEKAARGCYRAMPKGNNSGNNRWHEN